MPAALRQKQPRSPQPAGKDIPKGVAEPQESSRTLDDISPPTSLEEEPTLRELLEETSPENYGTPESCADYTLEELMEEFDHLPRRPSHRVRRVR